MWTSDSRSVRPLLPLLALVSAAACGLADDPHEEENRHTYIEISDPQLRAHCLAAYDLNGDGRLSRYEAQRVRHLSCPGLGIERMDALGEFTSLERLDCADNRIAELDLRPLRALRCVDCARNALVRLEVGESRSLAELDCSGNALGRLELAAPSLSVVRCSGNPLDVLDLRRCAGQMEEADATACPLRALYKGARQRILRLLLDDPSVVEEL